MNLKKISWTSCGSTDPGKTRKFNEDALLDKPEAGIWVVADGMGGHERGDFASAQVIENLDKLSPANDIKEYIRLVTDTLVSTNSELVDEAKRRNCNMIGCTVVSLIATDEGQFACLWAGDSRLYRLRDGLLQQLSKDHSEVQSLVDRGTISRENAESHPSANVINRAVGAVSRLQLDVIIGQVHKGDRYLLCSDGLYREVNDLEMQQCLLQHNQPELAVSNLLNLALDRLARDNITVLAIDFD